MLKDGNSAFADKNWNAYPDQWDVLLNRTEKLGMDDIERLMAKWQGELAQATGQKIGEGFDYPRLDAGCSCII